MGSKWNIKRDFTKHQGLSLVNIKRGIVKKAAITALLLTSVTLNLAFANEDKAFASFDKIYHVYLDQTYIGAVSDEKAVKKVIEAKEKEAISRYKEFKVDASSNVSLIPEQVFSYETNDSATLEKLNNVLVAQTEAFALQVDGELIAYLKGPDEYEETIRQLKLEYVTKAQLEKVEANNNSQEELPKLQQREERVVDINLIEDVSGKETKANPANILTPEEAVDLLKTGSLEKELYTVKAGDVLGKIAVEHGLKIKELLALNPDLNENSLLQIGQHINVTVEKPLINVQVVYEKLNVENIDYAKIVEEDEDMLKGDKIVKQEGSNGKKEVSYVITEVNGKRVEKTVTGENVLTEPENRIVVVGTKVVPSRGTGEFIWPTNGGYISSNMGARWGEFHQGIDIARPSNYSIKATDNGVVTFAGWDGSYGQKIVIDHNNGYETLYAHLSEINVSVGQVVAQGTEIGIMGTTGRSTGIHLHFEVHDNGSYVNPLAMLN